MIHHSYLDQGTEISGKERLHYEHVIFSWHESLDLSLLFGKMLADAINFVLHWLEAALCMITKYDTTSSMIAGCLILWFSVFKLAMCQSQVDTNKNHNETCGIWPRFCAGTIILVTTLAAWMCIDKVDPPTHLSWSFLWTDGKSKSSTFW